MNSSAMKRIEIAKDLSFIPDNQIDPVKTFIEFLLFRNGKTTKKIPVVYKVFGRTKVLKRLLI